jgi:CO/xanthine dehydrogenase Mo-binding subunit
MDPFMYRRLLAKALGITPSKVRIIQGFIGGNFGHCQCDLAHYVITALLAKKTGRPVRLMNTREEELIATRPRQPVITYLKTGVKKDGTLTARHIKTISNSGSYCGYAPQMMVTGLAEFAGLYGRCPNVKLEGKCVYTNTLPTSPSCCFGIKQPMFAQESLMDMIAEELALDPIELRLKNTVRAGDVTMVGQKIDSCGLQECLEKLAEYTGWKEARAKKQPNRGIGVALTMSHSDGMGRMQGQFGGDIAYVQVLEDGRVKIISGEFEWGQGAHTVLSQMVAEELGVPLEAVEFSDFNTDVLPHTLGPYGEGRVTLVAGHAVILAARDAKRQLLAIAADILDVGSEDLEMKEQKIFVRGTPEKAVSIADVASYGRYSVAGAEVIGKGVWEPDTALLDLHKVYGNYSSGYIFYAQVAEVEVDPETGRVKILNFAAGNDVGKAINPMYVEGQSEGDIGREIGVALMEEIEYDQGIVMNPNFTNYRLPTAMDIPPIKTFIVESNEPKGPYGAKGTSHPGMPTPAVLANAVYNAVGVRIKELPITPMKVLKALEERKGKTIENPGEN